eukprot:493421-Pleurochrysis_carterae.AAC.2
MRLLRVGRTPSVRVEGTAIPRREHEISRERAPSRAHHGETKWRQRSLWQPSAKRGFRCAECKYTRVRAQSWANTQQGDEPAGELQDGTQQKGNK